MILPLLRLDFCTSPNNALRAVMPYQHDAPACRWQRCDMVGRALSPKKLVWQFKWRRESIVPSRETTRRASQGTSWPRPWLAGVSLVFSLSPLKQIVWADVAHRRRRWSGKALPVSVYRPLTGGETSLVVWWRERCLFV